ncbi:MAG: histidine phosphatase family protein [Limnochordaceae bacterium]|nr:histidine phosphatase family protein [Limnochordaceae bacterium]
MPSSSPPLVAGWFLFSGRLVPGATRLLLIRHAQTDWNHQGLIQGQLDPPLNETGMAEARAVARAVRYWAETMGQPIRVIFSSDLQRAYQTAQIVQGEVGAPLHLHQGLREHRLGDWQGHSAQELQTTDAEAWQRWIDSGGQSRPPGGETILEVQSRMVATVEEIARSFVGSNVLVVSHGASLKALLCWVLGLNLALRTHFFLANASLTSVLWHTEKAPVLEFLNGLARAER